MKTMAHLTILALTVASLSAVAGILIVLSQRWHGKHTLDHDLKASKSFIRSQSPESAEWQFSRVFWGPIGWLRKRIDAAAAFAYSKRHAFDLLPRRSY